MHNLVLINSYKSFLQKFSIAPQLKNYPLLPFQSSEYIFKEKNMSHNLRIPRFIAFSRLFQSDVKVKILLNLRHVLLFYVSAPCLLLITYSFFCKWKVLRWYAYQVRMINISFLVTNFELLKVFLPAETLIKDWFWVGFFWLELPQMRSYKIL